MTPIPSAALSALALLACAEPEPLTLQDEVPGATRRMPAEWEPQAAVWLQWPQAEEGPEVEAAFVDIIEVIAEYEPVELIVGDAQAAQRTQSLLAAVDPHRLTLHPIPTDSSWLRDNGPRYVEVDGALVLQDWGFDGWGERWGPAEDYQRDDAVPQSIGALLELPVERVSMVHERGDLEVNGVDTALVNWSVVSHRNPGHSREDLTRAFQEALGVESVIWAEGFHPRDGTRGHIDGMARFVAEDLILVGDDGGRLMDRVAAQIAEQRPELRVQRLASPHAALFMNFLIGDGFVLVATSGDPEEDAVAQAALEALFPAREVRFVNVDALWRSGGGVHCVTNDQPEGA